jgi:two-component system CheB/CheR fusion protein
MPADVGRPLAHFAQKFKAPSLIDDAQRVLDSLTPIEDEVEAPDRRWYMRRILPYRTEDHRIEGVVITFTDITRRRAAEERQHILVSELRHRVRNVLATARSLATESGRATLQGDELDRFLEAFDARVNALARVQTLIIEDKVNRIDLENLVREELSAHAAREGEVFTIHGPTVTLTSQAAQMLALAIAELATNAIKFGAFSHDEGKVDVRWQLVGRGEDRHLQVNWKETGGRNVKPAGHRGFGMDLIENGLPYTLGGRASVTFQTDGLRCVIDLPVRDNVSNVVRDEPSTGD